MKEYRDTWRVCDSCGNILRCSHGTSQAQSGNNDEVNEGEGQNEAVDEYSAAWDGVWDAVLPSTEAGGKAEAPIATAEEPLYLLVKYDSRPFPDPSGSRNTGERGACCTIVSGIRPSDPFPVVMATILHRFKGTDGSHNPYLIAPTAQIDYVDIQFGAIAAHAPGFLGRRKIEEGNVGELLNYLRQRQGGDDILEIFLVPMNEQDLQEHVSKTFEDWMMGRGTKETDGGCLVAKTGGRETMYFWLVDRCMTWVAEKPALWTETLTTVWKQNMSYLWGGCKKLEVRP